MATTCKQLVLGNKYWEINSQLDSAVAQNLISPFQKANGSIRSTFCIDRKDNCFPFFKKVFQIKRSSLSLWVSGFQQHFLSNAPGNPEARLSTWKISSVSNESSSNPEETDLEDLEKRLLVILLIPDSYRLPAAKLESDQCEQWWGFTAEPSCPTEPCSSHIQHRAVCSCVLTSQKPPVW